VNHILTKIEAEAPMDTTATGLGRPLQWNDVALTERCLQADGSSFHVRDLDKTLSFDALWDPNTPSDDKPIVVYYSLA